jgi:acetyl-CoA synthetase
VLVRTPDASYRRLRERFAWDLPERFNIGVACADQHPTAATALIERAPDGTRRELTFGDLAQLSNRLANALRALGIEAGARVAIVLPQSAEAGLAHLAVYKLGAIAVPLSGLFGPEALRYRLSDCTPRLVITDRAHLDVVAELAREIGDMQLCLVDGVQPPHHGFWELLQGASQRFEPLATTPETPALIVYTSGTTGSPKGALHAHRALLGHLPGFELSQEFFPQGDDRFWTPADWSWIGGLMDALLPTWFHGRPIVAAARERFDPEWALTLLAREQVRNAFLPPTALKLMRQSDTEVDGVALRSVMSGGEALGEAMLEWGRERFDVTINEIYGQTEANYIVGNCASVWDVRPGSMGLPYPGHDVAVLDGDGHPVAPGERGEIAVRAGDPVMFLGYWERADATRAKFDATGAWLLTGDMATVDDAGYLWFTARNDDVINSAGYRIGPWEIEQCLMRHPAVEMAAAIGVPDTVRGEVVKAFVKLADRHEATDELEADIRALVRSGVAAYLYPRHVEFVDELPMTTTGKVRRAELRRLEAERRGGDADEVEGS